MHPNNLKITYSFDDVPDWLSYSTSSGFMKFAGSPSQTDVGTFTIIVIGTDTKNESATTTFQIDVQKNYYPVVQKQVDDQ